MKNSQASTSKGQILQNNFVCFYNTVQVMLKEQSKSFNKIEQDLSGLVTSISLFENFFNLTTSQKITESNSISQLSNKSSTQSQSGEEVEVKLMRKKRKIKLCTSCPHTYAKHYATGMCSNCYHSKGRTKKPWNCPHINKPHYALGLCQNCYHINYVKSKKSEKKAL